MSIGVTTLRVCLAIGLLGLAASRPASAAGIEYAVSQGFSVIGISMQMKPDEGNTVCFVAVTVLNGSGKDEVLEIALDSDDGYSATTFTGGPDRKLLKAGANETAEFKTLLRQLPKSLSISVRPFK